MIFRMRYKEQKKPMRSTLLSGASKTHDSSKSNRDLEKCQPHVEDSGQLADDLLLGSTYLLLPLKRTYATDIPVTPRSHPSVELYPP